MTHDADEFDLDDYTPEEREEILRERIKTEGAEAAYAALLGVCRDPKAPAPARATAGVALLRAGGYLEKQEGGPKKELQEMNLAELEREIKRTGAAIKAAKAATADDEAGDEDEDEPRFE